jgi:omega-hydroxy-beta-dihydromenaquinone-9 sulfotransferase
VKAFLPAGKALVSWLRAGASERTPRARLWAYRWKAYWFDANWRRQEMLYPPRPFEGEGGRNLLFVMGFWRSGTTLLHELLAAGPGMAAPRTWQCMNPSGFRIAGSPRAGAAARRPMDAVLVDALSPQEDEFALLARGAPSVYRAWLDPRRSDEVLPALDQETWLALPASQWLDDWRTFLGWCMPPSAARLVVKSPNHVFRLKALHRAWPRARMVWTLRDPLDAWQSNRKMWRAMTAMYGLWPARDEDIDRLLFKAMSEYAAALSWAADALAPVCVDFERLTSQSAEALHAITQRLELGTWSSAQPAPQRPETYAASAPLPRSAEALIARVRDLHRRLLGQVQAA